jgi:LacI family transcriptional regulator
MAKMIIPPLTTVRQPLYDIGKIAVEKLIQMIETGETVDSKIVDHLIVERQTVRSLT